MTARDRKQHEYRLQLEAEAAAREAESDADAPSDEDDNGAARRMEHQGMWVEMQIQQAMRRGDFDNLPGAGKLIPGLDRPHDPDWWVKSLIERERISGAGVLPPALALRTENLELDDRLDREATPEAVRAALEDFNARIVDARRQLQGGPPVITPLRDVDAEVEAWAARRTARIARQKAVLEQMRRDAAAATPPPWWRRVSGRLRPGWPRAG
jgi:hypothetical protein